MDSKIAEQILDELAPTFEAIESQSEALLRFVKEKGIATDEQLVPYLEQAAAASSVRWRALRVRMGRLFALAEKSEEEKFAKKDDVQTDSGKASSQAKGKEGKAPELWSQPVNSSSQQSAESDKHEPRSAEKQSPQEEGAQKPSAEKSAKKQSAVPAREDKGHQSASQSSGSDGKDADQPKQPNPKNASLERDQKPPSSDKEPSSDKRNAA